jgi:hypothetical protein
MAFEFFYKGILGNRVALHKIGKASDFTGKRFHMSGNVLLKLLLQQRLTR